MVDDSSIKNEEESALAMGYLAKIADYAGKYEINVGVEADLEPGRFLDFLQQIQPEYIYANFDSGNSSGIGYDPNKEIPILGSRIYNVHIKDRVYHGTTVALGTGSADFDGVFSNLKKIGYSNSIILQAARGIDGDESNNIEGQLGFVRKYVDKYQIGV
jgi:hexulose-6-phosphate isomerase